MKVNNVDINCKVIYRESPASLPVLEKENNQENHPAYSRVEIDDPGSSFLSTYLELYGEPGRLLGRYVSENGARDDYFFSLNNNKVRIRSTDSEIIDVALTGNGHLWKLTRDYISFLGAAGSSESRFPLTGIKIVGSDDDSAWVIGLGNAWFVDKEGKDAISYKWQGGSHSILAGGRLCSLNKTKDQIIFLDGDGTTTVQDVGGRHHFFEQLVSFSSDRYVTLEGNTFRIYDLQKLLYELPLQSIGILDSGELFISYTKNKTTFYASEAEAKEFKLPDDYSNHILPVVNKKDGMYTGYHLGVFATFNEKNNQPISITRMNELQYKELIHPFKWKAGQPRSYSVNGVNDITVSITGPRGVALVELMIGI